MATKSDSRPGKNKGVTPGSISRGNGAGSGSGSGGKKPKCWSFGVVYQEPTANDLPKGAPVSGVPNEGRLQILSLATGPVGYAPAAKGRAILEYMAEHGLKSLVGPVLTPGEQLRVQVCAEAG